MCRLDGTGRPSPQAKSLRNFVTERLSVTANASEELFGMEALPDRWIVGE